MKGVGDRGNFDITMEVKEDIRLLAKIRQGDSKSFDALFYKYWKPLFSAAYSRLKSQDLSQDVVQDVFIDIWNRRESIVIKSNLEVYLFTAVKYGVFKAVDASNTHESLVPESSVDYFGSDQILELEELYDLIESKLEMLPNTSSKIFRLYKYQGLSAMEISDLTGLAPQSVHNSIQKSLKFLQSELKEYSPLILLIFLGNRF